MMKMRMMMRMVILIMMMRMMTMVMMMLMMTKEGQTSCQQHCVYTSVASDFGSEVSIFLCSGIRISRLGFGG